MLENAVIYDYFYDKWIPFEEIVLIIFHTSLEMLNPFKDIS